MNPGQPVPLDPNGQPADADRERALETLRRRLMEGAAERWLPVPGWQDYYEVSDRGRVRSLDRTVRCSWGAIHFRPGVVMKLTRRSRRPDSPVYEAVVLRIGKRIERWMIHRLVLTVFVGASRNGEEGRHLNGDSLDNRLTNLAWGTHKENEADKLAYGGRPLGERHPQAKLTVAQVRAIRAMPRSRRDADIAAEYGVSKATVTHIQSGRLWKHLAEAA